MIETMAIPFERTEFLDVFRQFNEGVWPAQILLVALGVLASLTALHGRWDGSDRFVAWVLALLWGIAGAVYHWRYFSQLTPAAWLFGALFVIGALTFAVKRTPWSFGGAPRARMIAANSVVAYALFFYPLIGLAAGHRYPAFPTLGAPCPVVILTLGILLTARRIPILPLVLSVVWAIVATAAAASLGMVEDFGLTVAAAIAVVFLLRERTSSRVVMERSAD